MSEPQGDEQIVCPECFSTDVDVRINEEPIYHCQKCNAEFGSEYQPEQKAARHRIECLECHKGFETYTTQKRVLCPHCGHNTLVVEGRIAWLGENSIVRELAERPRTVSEVKVSNIPPDVREMVYRLSIPRRSTSIKVPEYEYEATGVLYLEGDVREAIRVFIEENTEFVREDMEGHSMLKRRWPEDLYTTLVEEYYWLGVNDE